MQIGELIAKDEKSTQQFTLVDIFALITFFAILLALFVPWLRLLEPDARLKIMAPLAIQLFMLVGASAYTIIRRAEHLKKGGKRLAVAFYGTTKWAGWLPIRSILFMVFLAAIQIWFAMLIAMGVHHTPFMVVHAAQFSYLFAQFVLKFLWRVYPGTLEFFENGVLFHGKFFTWHEIEIRDSQFFTDRVGVVIKPDGTAGLMTVMTRVSDKSRSELESLASRSAST